MGRLPLKIPTTEGDIYTMQRSAFYLTLSEITSRYLLSTRMRGCVLTRFPCKTEAIWLLCCSLRLAVGPEGPGKLRHIRPPPLPFTCFLIGLFHLARAANCLLGMLQLKYHIKHNKCTGDNRLGELPRQRLKAPGRAHGPL